MNNKYIIVRTFCDKEEIANKIIDTLLEKRLVSGTQKSEVYSKYWWNNELEECREYKIEFRTKLNLFDEVSKIIREIHDYEVCEITYNIIDGGNKEIFDWIDDNTGNNIVSI